MESGPNVYALGPGVKEKTLCDEAVQYAFYKNGSKTEGDCYTETEIEEGGDDLCPDGYEYVDKTSWGCSRNFGESVSDFFTGDLAARYRAVCRKTVFEKNTLPEKLQCCLRQDASTKDGTECPPGFCHQRINDKAEDFAGVDQGCFDVFLEHCMGEQIGANGKRTYDGRRMFTDQDCKAYVLREDVRNGPNKRRIADLMTKLCKAGGRFAASDPLCQCLLTTDENYCLTDDCFARQNRALADLAPCQETQICGNPESYKPPEPEGGCPKNICAPLLELKCVNLQSEEAINILVNCGEAGTMTPEQLAEMAKRLGVSIKDVERAAALRGSGQAVVSTGNEKKSDQKQPNQGKLPNEGSTNAGDSTLSMGAIIGIAVASLLVFVLLVIFIVQKSKRPHATPYFSMQPRGYQYR